MSGGGCKTCPVKGCDAQYRGSQCAALRAKAGADSDPMTNADRIRAMGDEELAEFAIMSSKFFCTKRHNEVCEKPMGCTECALNWLQQTAPEVSDEADS